MHNHNSQTCIITIIGPVGVGKTTQIHLLKKYFESRNIKVFQTYIKSNHIFSFLLNKLLIALGIFKKFSYDKHLTQVYPHKEIIKKLFPLRRFLDDISIVIKFFFTVFIPFNMGFNLLIEEGLIMTKYTYNIILPRYFMTQPKPPLLSSRLLEWITSKNHVNIILNASDEEVRHRRENRGYRQHESNEYIKLQKKWMEKLKYKDIIFINTSKKSIIQVHNEIMENIDAYIM